MKQLIAGALTAMILAALLWAGTNRTVVTAVDDPPGARGPGDDGASPAELRVRGLLVSAQEGDVSAYLGAFAGPIKERLGREIGERGREAFAGDLKAAARSRKSHAVFAPEAEGDEARVTVETVYPDRNERQTYRVERRDGAWFVTDVETVHSHQPKSKFGTPARYDAPEGVPVQGAIRVDTGERAGPADGDDGTGVP